MKMLKLAVILVFVGSVEQSSAQMKEIVDVRDGQVYPIIQLGTLNWFQRNLNYLTEESLVFESSDIPSGKWGRLYNKEEGRKVCPEGWRLPSKQDWEAIEHLDIFSLLDSSDWKLNARNNNSTGLSLQPSGMSHRRKFMNQYLSSTIWFEDDSNVESFWHLHAHGDNNEYFHYVFHTHKESIKVRKFAVRCVCEIAQK